MGMSAGGGGGGRRRMLAEINVTPMVDVMLVLLIIFMVAAGVQTAEVEQERQEMLRDAEAMLEEARAVVEKKKEKPTHSKVDIDLPKVDSEAVNLAEVRKLKLVVTASLVFSIDDTVLLDCVAHAPAMADFLGRADGAEAAKAEDLAFRPCLIALGEKLVDNHKLQEDKELYILADRGLDYGKVLRIMATVRQAGVTKFGLVAEPGVMAGAEVAPTPEPLP